MKKNNIIRFFVLIILFSANSLFAQELNCNVQVATPQIQSSDKEIYTTMQTAIHEFVNNRKWTNNVFKIEERIECSILITIQERISTDQFKASIQIQSRRPIYGTSYSTTMFNYIDKDFDFSYLESQSLDWAENTHLNNLTSVLAYYVYVILGIDYDSFSQNGGSTYFDKAQGIVNNAQSAPEKGWKSYESQKNRYWLIENLTNSNYAAFHEFLYKYHRLGIDVLADKADNGRMIITQSLDNLLKLKRNNPNIFFFQPLFTAKVDELVNIYSSKSVAGDKTAIVKTLNELDPANIGKYKNILGN
ncbi:MAG: DUF4835 family protein [Bacteroidota bacterium]